MKSRTSSCNLRVLRKDLTRFAPIWVEYSALLLLVFYILWSQHEDITGKYSQFLGLFAWVNAIYGFIVAIGLFGYLSDPRECNTVHSFPIRREEYFVVHLTAGFLMALVPNGLFCLLNLPISYFGNLPFIFCGLMLEFTCFYGLAIFSIFLTGRKFAAATVYALLNWLSVLVLWALEVLYLPLLPGVVLNYDLFFQFCPVVGMSFQSPRKYGVWYGMDPGQMNLLMVYAAVGAVLILVSLFLYRKRKLEYAGDFLAVKWLTPAFLFALSFACGCVLSFLGDAMIGEPEVMLVIGLMIGYFTGLMLMKKSVKVFRPRSVLGCAAVVALVLGSMFVTKLDPLNRVDYIPETEDVAMVEVAHDEMYFDGFISNLYPYHTEDPAIIGDLSQLHRDCLESNRNYKGDHDSSYTIRYHLKNGRTIIRYYPIHDPSLADRANFYYSQPESMINVSTLEELEENCRQVELHVYTEYEDWSYIVTGEDRQLLMENFFRDCKAGSMNPTSFYTGDLAENFYVTFIMKNDDVYSSYTIPETAEATREFCRELWKKYEKTE